MKDDLCRKCKYAVEKAVGDEIQFRLWPGSYTCRNADKRVRGNFPDCGHLCSGFIENKF